MCVCEYCDDDVSHDVYYYSSPFLIFMIMMCARAKVCVRVLLLKSDDPLWACVVGFCLFSFDRTEMIQFFLSFLLFSVKMLFFFLFWRHKTHRQRVKTKNIYSFSKNTTRSKSTQRQHKEEENNNNNNTG